MLTTALAVTAATWGVLMAVGPLFQIRAILRRGSSEGVSIAYFCVLLVGFALWIAYGAAAANLALVVPNIVAFTVALGTVAVTLRYR
jgi:uncharacterized protein with PQ loop repeat